MDNPETWPEGLPVTQLRIARPTDKLEELVRFYGLGLRKLQPGGLFILETVNPHSVPALKTFWVDPTHQHPLFPEVALALCEISGFESAYVFHPNGKGQVEVDRYETGEYAVVAKKAAHE